MVTDGIFFQCLKMAEPMERRCSLTDFLGKLTLLEKPVAAKFRLYWNLNNPIERGRLNGYRLLSLLKKPTWRSTSLDIFVTQESKAAEDRPVLANINL
ncbi:unnamed protein product [Ambrosiozyma monospora]|uniref:Unnamed protein product n=1 Tax=Ambrosiozyma monospora TaxID=43982 RepID=A0ACB5SZQ5_AMBMO|nr:unnamed protein product [Ambrosiozyma monospora]